MEGLGGGGGEVLPDWVMALPVFEMDWPGLMFNTLSPIHRCEEAETYMCCAGGFWQTQNRTPHDMEAATMQSTSLFSRHAKISSLDSVLVYLFIMFIRLSMSHVLSPWYVANVVKMKITCMNSCVSSCLKMHGHSNPETWMQPSGHSTGRLPLTPSLQHQ